VVVGIFTVAWIAHEFWLSSYSELNVVVHTNFFWLCSAAVQRYNQDLADVPQGREWEILTAFWPL